MHEAQYYRDQAIRLRRFAEETKNSGIGDDLERLAVDFDDIAEDLEQGLIEIRNPDLLPQRRRPPR